MGPTGTLVTAGMENSWRVFSDISVEANGVKVRGSVDGRVALGRTRRCRGFLSSDSGFSMKFVGKAKSLAHYPIFIHNRRKQEKLAYRSNGYYTCISS